MKTDRYLDCCEQGFTFVSLPKPSIRKRTFFREIVASVVVAGIVGYCAMQLAHADIIPPRHALLPQGYAQYLESQTDQAVFSKMIIADPVNPYNYAGSTFIWISGIPFIIPVYWPKEETVHRMYPWLDYPPGSASSACQFEPWNCK